MSTLDSARRILRRNGHVLRAKRDALSALHDGQLYEIARLARTEGSDLAELFRSLSDEGILSPSFARLCRTSLAGEISPDVLRRFLPESSPEDFPPDTRTAYLRNSYADRAFAAFSHRIDRLSAQYRPSFAAACEAVYDDRCSYCILPLQNSEDGLLTSFLRMIARYDLKIALASDVPMQDGDSVMRYALLRKGLPLTVPEDGRLLATVVLPEGERLGHFLDATEACGAQIEHVTTMPMLYSDALSTTHILFRVTRESTAPLLAFLYASLDSTTFDGLYEILR